MIKETKRERFIRLMKNRVERIKHQHKLIGNLANKINYDYDISMVNQVEDELLQNLDHHLKKFASEKVIKPFKFKD
jgi:hypothetical protein|tara:strand:+ start:634 stop:861 length:228 start_codon:yes stop_codon:yes gene_type:complete